MSKLDADTTIERWRARRHLTATNRRIKQSGIKLATATAELKRREKSGKSHKTTIAKLKRTVADWTVSLESDSDRAVFLAMIIKS